VAGGGEDEVPAALPRRGGSRWRHGPCRRGRGGHGRRHGRRSFLVLLCYWRLLVISCYLWILLLLCVFVFHLYFPSGKGREEGEGVWIWGWMCGRGGIIKGTLMLAFISLLVSCALLDYMNSSLQILINHPEYQHYTSSLFLLMSQGLFSPYFFYFITVALSFIFDNYYLIID